MKNNTAILTVNFEDLQDLSVKRNFRFWNYISGGASCSTGMVNKLFSGSSWLFDYKIQVYKKRRI